MLKKATATENFSKASVVFYLLEKVFGCEERIKQQL
jgi:hypothetical protein